jgi:3-aminobutyryl-CoA ammonia-lyase
MSDSLPEAKLRIRMSSRDAHYAGNLVDGARILNLFGDVATELTIRYDGDEGLLRAYDNVEFLAPVYAGDFIEVTGKITETRNTSRKISFEAYKVITASKDQKYESACDVLEPPVLVAKASGTCVVLKERQRKNPNFF